MAAGADDEAHLRITASEADLAAALDRSDEHLKTTERNMDSLGRTATKVGQEIDSGMSRATRATNRARDAAGRFVAAGHAAGTTAEEAGLKAKVGSKGFDSWAKSVDKAASKVGGFNPLIRLIKWGALITGGRAALGMLTSLASGATMAVGALSPMVGVLGAITPLLFLMGAGMAIAKISGKDLGALLRPLTNDFLAMRYEITQGLVPGVQKFNALVHDRMIPTLRTGLVGLSQSFGAALVSFGDQATSGRNVAMIGQIFTELNPIVRLFGETAGHGFGIFLNLTKAALPLLNVMGGSLNQLSVRLEAWSQRAVDSGKAQAWLLKAWDLASKSVHTLINFLVGLYNIFTLAGQVGRESFAGGLSEISKQFREWSSSEAGRQKILQFFRDMVPPLKETLALFSAVARGLGHLAANEKTAGLIHQIRTELGPALEQLFEKTAGPTGFGPAMIHFLTGIVDLLNNIPFGGLTTILIILGGLAETIVWLVKNVPGLGPAIGIFLTLWTVAGTALKLAGWGLKAFGWITKVTGPAKDLTLAQKALKLVLEGVSGAIKGIGDAVMWAIRGIGLAIAANPVGAIIVGIILLVGILVWAYFKFQWFHDFVNWVFHGIADGAVWLGKAIAQPFIDLWNGIKFILNAIIGAWNSFPSFTIPEWIPGVGGKTFSLPKIPLLEKGGVIEYGMAIVGERGPEPIVVNGRIADIAGLHGPELRTDLPRGGYVVPSVNTMLRSPAMMTTLPASVADAVSGVPGYAALLDRPGLDTSPLAPVVNVDTHGREIVDAVHELTDTLLRRDNSGDQLAKLVETIERGRRDDRRALVANRYRY